jgi:hypothetical protein
VDDACGVTLHKRTGQLSAIPDDQIRWDKFSCAGGTLDALGERSATETLEDEILDRAIRAVVMERDNMVVVFNATEEIGFAFRSVGVGHCCLRLDNGECNQSISDLDVLSKISPLSVALTQSAINAVTAGEKLSWF